MKQTGSEHVYFLLRQTVNALGVVEFQVPGKCFDAVQTFVK